LWLFCTLTAACAPPISTHSPPFRRRYWLKRRVPPCTTAFLQQTIYAAFSNSINVLLLYQLLSVSIRYLLPRQLLRENFVKLMPLLLELTDDPPSLELISVSSLFPNKFPNYFRLPHLPLFSPLPIFIRVIRPPTLELISVSSAVNNSIAYTCLYCNVYILNLFKCPICDTACSDFDGKSVFFSGYQRSSADSYPRNEKSRAESYRQFAIISCSCLISNALNSRKSHHDCSRVICYTLRVVVV
jgi:hypothetical protein